MRRSLQMEDEAVADEPITSAMSLDEPAPEYALSLEEQVVRLHALLEASRQVHSTISADEVLRQTARIVVRELEMDGAVFVSPSTGEPVVSFGGALQAPYSDCARFALLAKNNSLLSELFVRTEEGRTLSAQEQDFVESLALQAAVALENAELHERDLRWAFLQQDLDAARRIQQSLLPKSMPVLEGYSFDARSIACYEVGGDYLDVIAQPDGSHLLVVADVAGKGLASALVASSFRAALRSLATQALPLEEMARRLAEQHWAEGSEARRRYVTAILVRLHARAGWLEVVNAGHNPGLLVAPGGAVTSMNASGVPLGLLDDARYTAEWLPFPTGSRLLLYTDGLTEVFHGEEEFGGERLMELLRDLPTEEATEVLDDLWRGLRRFSPAIAQTDDMTALAVCRQKSTVSNASAATGDGNA